MRKSHLILSLAATPAAMALAGPLAFPGAVGFGDTTTGGRGGSVYVVTNLNDSGAGSFRDAVSEPNRIIVFAVGGYIDLQSAISGASNLTILGQTAPGQGIGFMGYEVSFSEQSNVDLQYLRFREGSTDPSEKASLNLGDLNGGIVDHVSAEFSQYDNIDAVGANSAADNITYSNDLIADPIKAQQLNLHEEGNQTTYIGNLFANNHGRNPLAKSNDQYVNNVSYDYGYAYTTGDSSGDFKYDIINNYFISGPATTSAGDAFYQLDSNQSAYSSGNLLDSNNNGVLDGSSVTPGGVTTLTSEWSPATQYLPTLSATAAYSFDVAHAGDSLSRDPVDSQIITQVQSLGTQGSIYNEQADDGLSNNGFGTITGGTAPTSTAGDGIPDTWAVTHGLSITDTNSATKLSALGYDMIEEYAAQLGDEYASQTWSNASGNWTTGTWSASTPGIYDHALIRGNGTTNGAAAIASGNTATAFSISIGGNGPAAGESLTISGGSTQVQDTIYVGDQNNGTLNISGGTVQAANIQLGNTVFDSNGNPTNYNGTFNFTGGTLLLQAQIVQGVGTPSTWTSGAIWTWSGGTIEALGNLTISAPATIGSGGAIINSNGFNTTISSVLTGTGSFTNTGTGVVALSGSNSYTGGTNINGGELSISSDANIGGATSAISFNGGFLQVMGTTLTNLNNHTVNWSTFNGGFDISNPANTFTVSQNIGGSGSLTMVGAGTLVLSGTSTFTGGVTLSGGTLIVSADANMGANGSTLTFNGGTFEVTGTALTSTTNHPLGTFGGGTFDIAASANVFTIEQQVNGAGNLIKSGPGTLVLGTRDYFTGSTTITGGTLQIDDPLSLRYSTVNLTTAGTMLNLNGINATLGGLSGSQGLDLQGTQVSIGNNNANTTYSGVISDSVGGGSVTKIGSGTWAVSGNDTYTGPLTISAGIFNVTTLNNGAVAGPLGDGMNVAGNLVLNSGTLQFTGTSGQSTDHLFTLTPSGGTLDGSGTSGDGMGFSNTGAIAFSGTGSRTLNLIGSETHNSFFPALGDPDASDKTSVTVNGTGRWLWESKLSTYSGDTSIVAGTLRLYQGGILPSGNGKGNVDVNTGATLVADTSSGINGLNNGSSGGGTVTISAGALTIGNGNAAGNFGGVINSVGGITKTGTGTQILSGANTYSGATSITGGSLQITSPGSLAGASVTVASGAALTVGSGATIATTTTLSNAGTTSFADATQTIATLNGAGTLSLNPTILTITGGGAFSGPITGTGGITVPAGSLVLSGTNTYSGETSITAGSIEIASPGSLADTTIFVNVGAGLIVDSGAAIAATTTLTDSGTTSFKNATQTIATLNSAGTLNLNPTILTVSGGGTFSGLVAGTGGITVSGGALILSHADTYTGATSITGGSLEIASPGSLAGVNVSISSGATLTVDSGASIAAATTLSDAGTTTFKNTTQSLATLNGAGTLNLTPTALTVSGGGTFSGLIAGTGSLTVSGGAMVLSHADTYSGTTTVTGGSLEIASPGSLASTTASVSSGATLTVDSSAALASTTALTDSGTTNYKNASQTIATLNGAGTLNLNPTILTISNGGTFSGPVAGTGGITASGGALILSGADTYTSATSITGGSLELASPGTLATSSFSVSTGATLTLDSGSTITSTPNLTDAGTATFKNSAVSVAALNGAGTLNLTPTALTVTNGGTFSGPITSTGSLTVSGGALILSGSDTYSGATSITGGSLEITSPGSITSTNVSVSSGALTVDSGATIASNTTLSNSGTTSFKNTTQSIATLNGSGNLNLNPTALTINGGGTFTGPISGTGSLTVAGSTLTLNASTAVSAITVAPAATLNINGPIGASPAVTSNGITNIGPNTNTAGPAPITLGSLTLGSAGNVTLDSAPSQSNRTVLVMNGPLTFANTPVAPQGSLDLMNNDLIVHNGTYSNVLSEFTAAYNGGLWTGSGGITSSVAAATSNTTLAVVLNDDGTGTNTPLFTKFDNQTVADGDVLVKYTYYGDALLTGSVIAADYVQIDNGFNSQSGSNPLTGWTNGDFNYDGVINGDDYTLIDNAYNTQGSVSFAGDSAGPTEMIATDTAQIAAPATSSSVPEPGTFSILTFAAATLARRRRRSPI